ncbi:hypothetical protein GGQ87_002283 [Brevundimonas alba]|uniref:Uncharacterized protein n=1 Tax=Brevundimonas alba TaxID=74314 RepID=A0A7X5YL89_9CAUL|nr:hypothetical protein [Brevundimonas alba]NJC41988.1 hypothetical protein [Brevundimonas alba]
MHTLILAAAFVASPQDPGQITRDIIMDVCLPYVSEGAADQAVIVRNGLSGLIEDGEGEFRSRNDVFIVTLTTSGSVDDGNLRRVCAVQARSSAFGQARDAIAAPLVEVGFAASPDEPTDWPVWTRGGVSISVHQNPGRATIVRASYSSLDAEGL